jgi:4-amino-4-deoxy-L-arabinose transferase-like glycosyltransferase
LCSFTFSKSKLPGYILPSIPPLTILTGDYLNRVRQGGTAEVAAVVSRRGVRVCWSSFWCWRRSTCCTRRWCRRRAGLLIARARRRCWTLLLVVLLIRWGGIAKVRNATLIPVVGMMVFLLGFYGKELDLNYSARPLAQEMARDDPDVRLVAVQDVRRDMVYGLAFYRNEEPIDYTRDGADVRRSEHLLVVPTNRRRAAARAGWRGGCMSRSFSMSRRGLRFIKCIRSSELRRVDVLRSPIARS